MDVAKRLSLRSKLVADKVHGHGRFVQGRNRLIKIPFVDVQSSNVFSSGFRTSYLEVKGNAATTIPVYRRDMTDSELTIHYKKKNVMR